MLPPMEHWQSCHAAEKGVQLPEAPPTAAAPALSPARPRPQKLGPYHYLAFVGVLPSAQGKGAGGRMLAHLLQLCDASGLPTVLAATAEANRRLYLRHGFQDVAHRRWSHPKVEGCAQLFWMVRYPGGVPGPVEVLADAGPGWGGCCFCC
jgi:predicted N-acetyltransferase YhbS